MDERVNSWNFRQTIADVFNPSMVCSYASYFSRHFNSKVFCKMQDFQALYEVFINNYEKSFELVRNLRNQKGAFSIFLKVSTFSLYGSY